MKRTIEYTRTGAWLLKQKLALGFGVRQICDDLEVSTYKLQDIFGG